MSIRGSIWEWRNTQTKATGYAMTKPRHANPLYEWMEVDAAEVFHKLIATPPAEVEERRELSDETIDTACVAWNRCILYGQGTAAGIEAACAILAKSKEKAS